MRSKRIFVEIPTWLGDAVMTTPALQNLCTCYPECRLTLFGSFVSTEALKAHPNVAEVVVDRSKGARSRLGWLYRYAKGAGSFDLALSFRRPLSSKLLLLFLKAKEKARYRRHYRGVQHQVYHYNDFINRVLQTQYKPHKLRLYYRPKQYDKPTLGINPGATYGSAKRWYPERFAQVAAKLCDRYDIVIFGGPSEVEMAGDVEKALREAGVQNYRNLAGKTSVTELIEHIAGLACFVTNDSGPMHVAAAYDVPTVAVFGPTKYKETAPYSPKALIVRKELECSPCMKRVCPLGTHECMKSVEAADVLQKVAQLKGVE